MEFEMESTTNASFNSLTYLNRRKAIKATDDRCEGTTAARDQDRLKWERAMLASNVTNEKYCLTYHGPQMA